MSQQQDITTNIKDVYSKISKEFNRTRWNVWPNVGNFIDSFEANTERFYGSIPIS